MCLWKVFIDDIFEFFGCSSLLVPLFVGQLVLLFGYCVFSYCSSHCWENHIIKSLQSGSITTSEAKKNITHKIVVWHFIPTSAISQQKYFITQISILYRQNCKPSHTIFLVKLQIISTQTIAKDEIANPLSIVIFALKNCKLYHCTQLPESQVHPRD